MPNSITLNFNKIKKPSDFELYRNEWTQLENGPEMTAYQQFQWNQLLVEKWFSDKRNLFFGKMEVIRVYLDNKLKIISLVEIYSRNIRLRNFYSKNAGVYIQQSSAGYSDYLNLIYNNINDDILKDFINELKSHYNLPIVFTNLREDTLVSQFLIRNINPSKEDVSMYIDLSADIKLSKSTRQNIRTAQNRLTRDDVKYSNEMLIGPQSVELSNRLDEIHTERISERYGYNKRKDIFSKLFVKKYNVVQESMYRNEKSFYWIVRCDSRIAGFLYGIIDNRAIRVIYNCFRQEYKFYSPLFLGCYNLMLQEKGNPTFNEKVIDFTKGDEEYKIKLGAVSLKVYNYVV